MNRPSPLVGLFGFIALLIALSPFARVLSVNIFLLVGLGFSCMYATGVWVFNALRDHGESVIFAFTGERRSHAFPSIARAGESTTSRLAALEVIPYNGFVAPGIGPSDHSAAVVPTAAVEDFGDGPVEKIVYAPTQVTDNPNSLKALVNFAAAALRSHSNTSFSEGKGSRTEVRVSFLNDLVTTVTQEALADQSRLINNAAILTDLLEKSSQGAEAHTKALSAHLRSVRRGTLSERFGNFLSGGSKKSKSPLKPEQNEMYGD